MDTVRSRNVSGVSGWNVGLGIWSIISPFVLGFTQNHAFLVNNIVVGAVIGILALIRSSGHDRRAGTSWLNVILGIWMIISPFALGFTRPAAVWNNVILGILVALFALGSASYRNRDRDVYSPPVSR